jgi:RNA polymerase sigma factor (TIGR02999 family)
MSDLTQLLQEAAAGDRVAVAAIFPVVYEELRRMATAQLGQERVGQTLTPTGLVHEAYLRLVGNGSFESRRHFFGAAVEAMRRILVDRARERQALKRGGDLQRVELTDLPTSLPDERLLDLHDALDEFQHLEPEKAELVKLRFFAGLSLADAAELVGVSLSTANRMWAYSRAWLADRMG